MGPQGAGPGTGWRWVRFPDLPLTRCFISGKLVIFTETQCLHLENGEMIAAPSESCCEDKIRK